MAIALMTGAMGCSVDVLEVDQEESLKIVFEASPFVDGDSDADTRTSVVPNETYSNYEFIWSAKDTVGIYPDAGSQIFFTMENGAGASSATFDGGAWTCKEGHTFRSYYPFIGDIYLDATKIPVSFTGQKQVGNGNSDHFQKYDYMYTAATTKDSGFLNFSYSHLITAVLPWVELPAGHYTGLTLSLDEALFVTEGEYDLTAASPAIVGKKFSDSMSIELDVTFTSSDILKVYVPLAPMDMSGKTLTVTITNENGREFEYTYKPSKPYAASKIYRLKAASSLVQPNNVIYYTSTDGNVVTPNATDGFGANIVSNKYVDGQGIITFGGDVTSIGDYAFMDCYNLSSIQIPSSVTRIGMSAFSDCYDLTSITIPESVTIIDIDAFEYCYGLTSIILPKNISVIGSSVFLSCSNLTSIIIPDGVTKIENDTFCFCESLISISIPSSVTTIGGSAFYGCSSLERIMMPEGLRYIGVHAFGGCSSLVSVHIPESVSQIGDGAFMGCSSINLFSGRFADSSGKYLVDNGSIVAVALGLVQGTIIIPQNVNCIGGDVFRGYDGLTSITIPSGVIKIKCCAFYDCINLKSITIEAQDPPTGESAMFDNTNNCSIFVPAESVDEYKAAKYWSNYADRIQPIAPLPEAVDLGLPSELKWASFNLGASAPEEYGDYFAWGETEPKESNSWETYKWSMGSNNTLTKYCSNSEYGYNGFTDTKTVLDLEDDAANVNLGGKWRMPTIEEWTELQTQCAWEWTIMNGIYGRKVTGPNGNRIFLPAAGDQYYDVGSAGRYWSSSLLLSTPYAAKRLFFSSGGVTGENGVRFLLQSIRPVTE